jgi:hypothetical protein
MDTYLSENFFENDASILNVMKSILSENEAPENQSVSNLQKQRISFNYTMTKINTFITKLKVFKLKNKNEILVIFLMN